MVKGELAGIKAAGPAPIEPGALTGSLDYRAGFLGGHLLATLYRTTQPLPPRIWVCAARYGRALVDPGVEEVLLRPAPSNVIDTHAIAWRHATEKSGPMHPNLRRATLLWLQNGLGVVVPPEQTAALEKRWQEREGYAAPVEAAAPPASEKLQPLKAIGVVARSSTDSVDPAASGALALAFGLPDQAWEAARLHRYDESADPLADRHMRGFLEVLVGDKVILRKAPVSVFAAVCGLARARAEGFPDTKSVCVLDDSSGTWALHLVRDPDQPRIQITETYTGAMAYAPTKAVAGLIDVFLKRFVDEASGRVPEITSWGELRVLGRLPSE